MLSGGSFAFAGTDLQRAQGIGDSAERLCQDLIDVGGGENDPALVRVYGDNQLETYAWLRERGVTFGPVQAASGQSVPRQHPANPREVIRLLGECTQRLPGLEIVTGARAVKLTRDPATWRVNGVVVERGGATSAYVARRAVVLASGGFSRNEDMLRQFAPAQAQAKRVGGAGSTGDGLKMAMHAGAGLRDMGYVKGTFGNHPAAGPEQHTAMLAIYRGAIAVNRSGERFADESISYKLLGDACLRQPGAVGFQVFDQAIMETEVRGVPIFDFSRRLEEGLLFKAPSLEALAAKIELPARALEATVAAYNRSVAGGRDEAFGRRGLVQGRGELRQIDRAPFYAYPSTSAVIATYCGVTVDPQLRVLDVFGDAVPGLYAAGEMTGGFHGVAFMTGTSLGKCAICGRIAGRNAAKEDSMQKAQR